jgi:NADH-quinone oxidoreductase subunit J
MIHLAAPPLALGLPGAGSGIVFIFAVNTLIAVFSALNVLLQENPVHSALFLIANFCSLAVYYLLLDAQFLAVVQIIVYAGAIMVLFLFVITLLSPGREETGTDRLSALRLPSIILGLILGFTLAGVLLFNDVHQGLPPDNPNAPLGTVQIVGTQLFHNFLFPFEVTSLLLLVAMLGAIVLAKRRID